jgi:hypothetical protein
MGSIEMNTTPHTYPYPNFAFFCVVTSVFLMVFGLAMTALSILIHDDGAILIWAIMSTIGIVMTIGLAFFAQKTESNKI